MANQSYLTCPAALSSGRLFLTSDVDGWCDGVSKDQTLTLRSPNAFAEFIADPGGHLRPADDQDCSLMLDGLRRYRDLQEKLLTLPLPKHDAGVIRKGITHLDAEIVRLSDSKS